MLCAALGVEHTRWVRLAMSEATEGTIAWLPQQSGTILVKRYAHLSPSRLQGEIEKESAFGKVREQSTAKEVRSYVGAKSTDMVGEQRLSMCRPGSFQFQP